jgi:hypothetical protein
MKGKKGDGIWRDTGQVKEVQKKKKEGGIRDEGAARQEGNKENE